MRKRPSPEDDFRVVVRRERLVNRVRLHVESAARTVEETAHREQPILGSAGDEVERRSPAEDDGVVRGPQPLDAEPFRWKENSESLMDAEHRRDARENIHVEGEGTVLARLLAPVVICGSRGIPEDEETLLFG